MHDFTCGPMKHTLKLPTRLIARTALAVVGATVTTTALLGPAAPPAQADLQDSPKAVLDEAWQIVNREYVDGSFNKVDWKLVRQELIDSNYTNRDQAYTALRKVLERLNDPYTRFMDPKQYESLSNQTSGELSGVGIRLEVNEKTKILTVVEPIENSPASAAGIQSGDQIISINGKPTQGMTVEDASGLIRGKPGSQVTLEFSRSGARKTIGLTRRRIELKTVTAQVKQDGGRKVGYLQLREFSSHAADQMRRGIKTLLDQKVDGFVLDLRGNPGGLLQASIEISRMWMDRGTIVRTVDRKGNNEEITNNQSALTRLPLVVLVDNNSASSSEILTGALKDNKRATVVGSQTFGKALVQSVHALSDGSGIAVTIAHYYTPNGTDISSKGLDPDVRLDLTDADRKFLSANPQLIATMKDPQYAKAIATLDKLVAAQGSTRATKVLPPLNREATLIVPVKPAQ
jgi:carboxyl-terminal processing protease